MDFFIREITFGDYQAAYELWQNTEGLGLSSADEKKELELFLGRNPHLSFIAVDGEKLVGTVLCGHDGRRGFMYHLAVEQSYRKKGIGRKLVEKGLEGLKLAGIKKCHIMVLSDNPNGLNFWKQIGWQRRDNLTLMSRSLD